MVGICPNNVAIGLCAFKRIHHVKLPTNKFILKCYNDFSEKGCTCDQRTGQSTASKKLVDGVKETFVRCPWKTYALYYLKVASLIQHRWQDHT